MRGKTEALDELQQDLPSAGQTSFTRQQEPLGLGHAVWCARELVGNQPFALLLPDMVFKAKPGVLKQMMEAYEETGGNVIGVEEVDRRTRSRPTASSPAARARTTAFAITGMVEKPKPEDAPSNLFISGRYILQPEIFALLAEQPRGAGGEIQLTDAMQTLMPPAELHRRQIRGPVFDCGGKIGFLTANVAFALDRPDIAGPFLAELEEARARPELSA